MKEKAAKPVTLRCYSVPVGAGEATLGGAAESASWAAAAAAALLPLLVEGAPPTCGLAA